MSEREEMICMTPYCHPVHDWDYKQDWGGNKTFEYHCPGIAKIVIIDQNGKRHIR